jgi:uncharacterized membrane protein YdjX (TVP38/TMEM64 family)
MAFVPPMRYEALAAPDSAMSMLQRNGKSIFLLFLLLAVFAALGYGLYATGTMRLLTDREALLAFVEKYEAHAVTIAILLQALQVVAAPIPGEVTGFVIGALFGPYFGVLYATIGLTIGSWIAFILARALGRPLVERIVNPATIKRFDYVMKHKGLFLAFVLFLIPGFPKDILCYVLGLGHMSQKNFLIISTTGRLFGTVLLTLGGAYFRDQRWIAFFTVVGIGLLTLLAVMVYRKSIERGLKRLHAWQRLQEMIARRTGKKSDRSV